jgi:dihydrofolate reductase
MRKIVVSELLSLDGVAETPDKILTDWDDAVMDANMSRVIDTQDAVILGRRSYDEWVRFWPGRRLLDGLPAQRLESIRSATSPTGNCSWITASFVSPTVAPPRVLTKVATDAEALHRLRRTSLRSPVPR